MRLFISVISLLLLPICCFANKKDKAIMQCFENYRSAVLKNNGNSALNYISSSTLKLYDELLDKALHADSSVVHTMTVMNKVSVLAIRAEKEKAVLEKISGVDLFTEAVEKDKLDITWLMKFRLNDITVDDTVAQASLIYEDEKIAFKFRFVYEYNSWRFDLLSFFKINEYLIIKDIQDSGKTENEFIIDFLEQAYGKLSDTNLWAPLE